jgi:hypothetical protein
MTRHRVCVNIEMCTISASMLRSVCYATNRLDDDKRGGATIETLGPAAVKPEAHGQEQLGKSTDCRPIGESE